MSKRNNKEREYAILSELAYAAEKGRRDFGEEFARYGLTGRYRTAEDEALHSANHVTFVDQESGRAVVAFRGTRLTNRKDLSTDAAIFFGVEPLSKRFRDAVAATKRAQEAYGEKNVHVTGHSLGGTQALHAADNLGVEAHAFNPGKGWEEMSARRTGGPLGALLGWFADSLRKGKRTQDNAHVYTTGLDPISAAHLRDRNAGKASVHVRPVTEGWDVHGIRNFTTGGRSASSGKDGRVKKRTSRKTDKKKRR